MDINEQLTATERMFEAFREGFEYGFERIQDDLAEEKNSLSLLAEEKAKFLCGSWGLSEFPEVQELLASEIHNAYSSRAALNGLLSLVEV